MKTINKSYNIKDLKFCGETIDIVGDVTVKGDTVSLECVVRNMSWQDYFVEDIDGLDEKDFDVYGDHRFKLDFDFNDLRDDNSVNAKQWLLKNVNFTKFEKATDNQLRLIEENMDAVIDDYVYLFNSNASTDANDFVLYLEHN